MSGTCLRGTTTRIWGSDFTRASASGARMSAVGLGRVKTSLPLDERINDANRIVFVDPVIEASRQQRKLPPIRPLDEPSHLNPRRFSRRIIASGDFSHSLGHLRSIYAVQFHVSSTLP